MAKVRYNATNPKTKTKQIAVSTGSKKGKSIEIKFSDGTKTTTDKSNAVVVS